MNMDTLFRLSFESCITKNNNYEVLEKYELTEKDCFESKNELLANIEDISIKVKENRALRIELLSNDPFASFSINIMDAIPQEAFYEIERTQNKFLANTGKRYLYDFSKKGQIEYPMLIPGKYIFNVCTANNYYYSIIEIKPLHLEDEQLEGMREEIEKISSSLAKDFRSKGLNSNSNLKVEDIKKKINFITNNSKVIIQSLQSLKKNPSFEIRKNFHYTNPLMKNKIDKITIRENQKRPFKNNQTYTFNNIMYYDNYYNQNLKKMIFEIDKILGSCIVYLKDYKAALKEQIDSVHKYQRVPSDKINELKNIEQYLKSFNQIIYSSYEIQKQDWFNQTSNISFFKQINKSLKKSWYSDFYKVYMKLKRNTFDDSEDILSLYGYYWKETSKLYEIWGLLQIIEILKSEKLGFLNLVSLNNEKEEITYIEGIFNFIYENNLEIHLFYDKEISRNPNTNDNILTASKHNKPDIRIDIYVKGKYIQSMIGDFKYRKFKLDMNKYVKNDGQYNLLYEQILDYSNIRLKNKKTNVYDTFCMVPKQNQNYRDGMHLKTISLVPNQINLEFKDFIISSIKKIVLLEDE